MSDESGNRDRNFWEECYESFKKPLLACALKLVNGRTCDADDLVQETIYRAIRYSTNPEGINNPLGYLLRIMRNSWFTKLRKERSTTMVSLDELLSQEDEERRTKIVEPAVDPVAQRILEHEELKAQFSAMRGPLKEREDLLLGLYLEGYNCEEIAERLGEDVRLIRSDLNAVRTKVRTRIMNALGKQREGQH